MVEEDGINGVGARIPLDGGAADDTRRCGVDGMDVDGDAGVDDGIDDACVGDKPSLCRFSAIFASFSCAFRSFAFAFSSGVERENNVDHHDFFDAGVGAGVGVGAATVTFVDGEEDEEEKETLVERDVVVGATLEEDGGDEAEPCTYSSSNGVRSGKKLSDD